MVFWCRVLRAESRKFLLNRLYKTAISLSWSHALASRRPTEMAQMGTLVCWRFISRANDKVIDAHQRTRRVLYPDARQRTRPGGKHLLHVCLRRGPRRQPLLQLPHALRHRRMVSRGALVWVIDARRSRAGDFAKGGGSAWAGFDTACVLCRHIAAAEHALHHPGQFAGCLTRRCARYRHGVRIVPPLSIATVCLLAALQEMCCARGGCRSLFDLVIVTMSLVSLAPLGTANTRRGPCELACVRASAMSPVSRRSAASAHVEVCRDGLRVLEAAGLFEMIAGPQEHATHICTLTC